MFTPFIAIKITAISGHQTTVPEELTAIAYSDWDEIYGRPAVAAFGGREVNSAASGPWDFNLGGQWHGGPGYPLVNRNHRFWMLAWEVPCRVNQHRCGNQWVFVGKRSTNGFFHIYVSLPTGKSMQFRSSVKILNTGGYKCRNATQRRQHQHFCMFAVCKIMCWNMIADCRHGLRLISGKHQPPSEIWLMASTIG